MNCKFRPQTEHCDKPVKGMLVRRVAQSAGYNGYSLMVDYRHTPSSEGALLDADREILSDVD